MSKSWVTKSGRYLRSRLLFLASVTIVLCLVKAPLFYWFYEKQASFSNAEFKADLLARRQLLVDELTSPHFSPQDMPFFLPEHFQGEWAMGSLSMTATALVNLAVHYPETRREAAQLVEVMVKKAMSDEFIDFDRKAWFGEDPIEDLDSENGHIGYLGHLNLMLASHSVLSSTSPLAELHEKISLAIIRKIKSSRCLLAETYPGEVFVPDNVAALASLRYSTKDHSKFLNQWARYARAQLVAPNSRLLNFRYDKNCRAIIGPRGTGAGWNSYYLPFVSPTLQKEQYQSMKAAFLSTKLFGIQSLREWPDGEESSGGDIDSGPVIMGLSPAGSVLAIGGARWNGDNQYIQDMQALSEIVGTTVSSGGKRHYLLAPLVGDAIYLAMISATSWEPLASQTK